VSDALVEIEISRQRILFFGLWFGDLCGYIWIKYQLAAQGSLHDKFDGDLFRRLVE